jgi:haloalkane dehalogenase
VVRAPDDRFAGLPDRAAQRSNRPHPGPPRHGARDDRFAGLPDWPYERREVLVPAGPTVPEVDTISVAHIDEGPSEATPVVLLHGEPTWGYLYRHMVRDLLDLGYRVLVPDQVGFGRSDQPVATSAYTYAAHVAWIGAWWDAVVPSGAVFFGQDWGSLVGLAVATQRAEAVRAIVIGNGILARKFKEQTGAFAQWQAYVSGLDYLDCGAMVAAYKKAHGGEFTFDLQTTFDPGVQDVGAEIKRQARKLGITVNLPAPVDEAQIINLALAGRTDAFLWRNYPGSDPDTLYVWFRSGSPINFGKLNDPVIDRLLEEGRVETDPAARKAIYTKLFRHMSSNVSALWFGYNDTYIAANDRIRDIIGPNLPNEAGKHGTQKPVQINASYHQLLGLWKR